MYRVAPIYLQITGVVEKGYCLPEGLVGFSVSRQGAAALNRIRETGRKNRPVCTG
jgi:hypothetical protein